MARKPRIEYEGAHYHVMSRGDRREAIFYDDEDRNEFLRTLGDACDRCGWRVHAYVLMSNHYHVLLETPQPNLVKGMHWLQSSYTIRFNARHRLHGHVFQGRYKAISVEGSRNYLFSLADYIHLNPVRAKMIGEGESLLEYRWSSLPGYGEPGIHPVWLECGSILGEMAKASQPMSGRAYVEQVLQREREEAENINLEEDDAKASWFLGSEQFGEELVERLKEKDESKTKSSTPPRPGGDYGESKAQRIIEEGLAKFNLSESMLPTLPKSDWRKRMIGFEIRKRTSVSLGWISSRLKNGSSASGEYSLQPNRGHQFG